MPVSLASNGSRRSAATMLPRLVPGDRTWNTPSERATEVTEVVREAVASGRMPPRITYSTGQLMEMLSAPREIVLAAVSRLVDEEMMQHTGTMRGYRVVPLSARTVEDAVGARSLIEPPAMRALADSWDGSHDAKAAELRTQAMTMVEIASSGDHVAYRAHNERFHTELVALLGNPEISKMVKHLHCRQRMHSVQALHSRGLLVRSSHEHLELLELVTTGHGVAAQHLSLAHLLDAQTGRWPSSH
jgi:DNA-binding GntR family transcriptional regulator